MSFDVQTYARRLTCLDLRFLIALPHPLDFSPNTDPNAPRLSQTSPRNTPIINYLGFPTSQGDRRLEAEVASTCLYGNTTVISHDQFSLIQKLWEQIMGFLKPRKWVNLLVVRIPLLSIFQRTLYGKGFERCRHVPS